MTDPNRAKWLAFAGPARRLHAGDFVRLLLANDAVVAPLETADAMLEDEGERYEAAALEPGAFGLAKLDDISRSARLRIRPAGTWRTTCEVWEDSLGAANPQIPWTAGRVAAGVAQLGDLLETFVTYVIADKDDAFIVGRVIAEFERRAAPGVVRIADLKLGDVSAIVTPFAKAATLIEGKP